MKTCKCFKWILGQQNEIQKINKINTIFQEIYERKYF